MKWIASRGFSGKESNRRNALLFLLLLLLSLSMYALVFVVCIFCFASLSPFFALVLCVLFQYSSVYKNKICLFFLSAIRSFICLYSTQANAWTDGIASLPHANLLSSFFMYGSIFFFCIRFDVFTIHSPCFVYHSEWYTRSRCVCF